MKLGQFPHMQDSRDDPCKHGAKCNCFPVVTDSLKLKV
jgi:hypothetical protein